MNNKTETAEQLEKELFEKYKIPKIKVGEFIESVMFDSFSELRAQDAIIVYFFWHALMVGDFLSGFPIGNTIHSLTEKTLPTLFMYPFSIFLLAGLPYMAIKELAIDLKKRKQLDQNIKSFLRSEIGI